MPKLQILRGVYRDKLLDLDDVTAAAAVADGWATDPAEPIAIEPGTDLSQTPFPQSLLDFEANGKVEAPEVPPDPPVRSRRGSSSDE